MPAGEITYWAQVLLGRGDLKAPRYNRPVHDHRLGGLSRVVRLLLAGDEPDAQKQY